MKQTSIIRFFAAHPTAGNILMLILLAVGISALPSIKKETFPTIESHEVQVRVPYPGASALDVEEGICRRLEDATDGLSYIEEKRCDARDNLGTLTLKMSSAGDMPAFVDDVNSALDSIDDFPDQAETASVIELGRTQHVATLALAADVSLSELKTLAEQLKTDLLQYKNINKVDISGFSERVLSVEVSAENLRKYNLSLPRLADIIKQQGIDLPVGILESSDRDYSLRFTDLRRTVEDLQSLIILYNDKGAEITLGELATIKDSFSDDDQGIYYNEKPAAFLNVSKNKEFDSLNVLDDINHFIESRQAMAEQGVDLVLTNDAASLIGQRLDLLVTNGWQGMLLVFFTMWLFFSVRYAFWVVMGLPVAFLAGFVGMLVVGVSINMLSMVALLMALGLLMDDAIVLSESIADHMRKGLSPLEAAVQGVEKVAKGVFSSFVTTLCIFTGLIFIEGDIGQVLKVIPITLILVMTLSLIEAFLILPHHLKHSLEHKSKKPEKAWRLAFESWFAKLTEKSGKLADKVIEYRYLFVGSVLALFIVSISMLTSGTLKFSAFPNVEGDRLEARLLMPQGTPLEKTEEVLGSVISALNKVSGELPQTSGEDLIKNVFVRYGMHGDAYESGPHLATLSIDLLTVEVRNTSIKTLLQAWREELGVIPGVLSLQLKEPGFGPAGRAIEIRLQGQDLEQLSQASLELRHWLSGYQGVVDVMDDLRPGKPEFQIKLAPGAMSLGLDANTIASQLRAAYQGVKVKDVQHNNESYEIKVKLAGDAQNALKEFDYFPIQSSSGAAVPLTNVANIQQGRSWGRINRIDGLRTVTVMADVSTANSAQVLQDLQKSIIPELQQRYKGMQVGYQGEKKNAGETQDSMKRSFIMGLIGVYLLLAFQFRNYIEPVVVMAAIPLALIGVVWGHLLLGINLTMPSMIGFISLAGIVVNDSILLVEFVKYRSMEGLSVHDAARFASRDRFRAVLLTSLTTIAGLTPLLFETSLQAQVLIPLVVSIIFGIAVSTVLVLYVVPALYSILEDFGFTEKKDAEQAVSPP